MRKQTGLLLIILIALAALSMPLLRGVDSLHIDRWSLASVGGDLNSAIEISGLNDGAAGAVFIGSAENLGTITNNFKHSVELEITVGVEILQPYYNDNDSPEWRNINIFVGNKELQFEDKTAGYYEEITAYNIILNPGESINIANGGNSFLHLPPGTDSLDFLGAASFYIKGYNSVNDNLIFEINSVDDLRRQYFTGNNGEDNGLSDYPLWDDSSTYNGGDLVIYDGKVFQARYYVGANQIPGSLDSPWQEITHEWRHFNVYHGDDSIIYDGREFIARNWTRNEQPGLLDSPWQEITDQWRAFNVYTAGDEVWHNGQKYSAKWYTKNAEPGVSSAWEPIK